MGRRMNILYLGGESGNWIVNLCNSLSKLGNIVTCVIQDSDKYEDVKPLPNVTLISLKPDNFNEKQIYYKILNKSFDVIMGSHVNVLKQTMDLAKILNLPWGFMVLDVPKDLIEYDRQRQKLWDNYIEALKQADLLIFNTPQALKAYQEISGQQIELNCGPPIVYAFNQIEEYKNSGSKIKGDYVLSICRLTPLKNCVIIPEALGLLEQPKKYIAIGRDGGQLNQIRESCIKYGIEFIHKENITDQEKFELIKNSLCLVYPQVSEYIGGLSPFESMYCGKPTIVPDIKVLSDLYLKYTKYYNNTVEGLASQIAKVQLERIEEYSKELVEEVECGKEVITISGFAAKNNFDSMAKKIDERIKKVIFHC